MRGIGLIKEEKVFQNDYRFNAGRRRLTRSSLSTHPKWISVVATVAFGMGLLYAQDASRATPATWTQLSPVSSPSARTQLVLAYDAAHNQTVLFGGVGDGPELVGCP